MAAGEGSASRGPRQVPLLEWGVAGLGALLVAGTIGYLAFQALGRDQTPPELRVVALRVLAQGHGHLVEFRALNEGGEPVAQLLVEGELTGPAGPIESARAILDYLPPRSQRDGGLLFSRDPRAFELRLRAKGYATP